MYVELKNYDAIENDNQIPMRPDQKDMVEQEQTVQITKSSDFVENFNSRRSI